MLISAPLLGLMLALAAGLPAGGPPVHTGRKGADPQGMVIPMEFSAGRATVQVTLDGKGPYPFVFDTGASGGVIDAALADELNLPVVGRDSASDGRHEVEVESVRISELRIGEKTLTDMVFAKMDIRGRFASHFLGVLGISVLGDELVTLDFPARKIVLRPGHLAAGDPAVVNLQYDQGIYRVKVEIADQDIPMHLDTGSSLGITLTQEDAAKLKFTTEPVRVGTARTATGEVGVWEATLDTPVLLAGQVLPVHKVQIIEGLPLGQIGHRVLRDLVLTLDPERRLMRLEKPRPDTGNLATP